MHVHANGYPYTQDIIHNTCNHSRHSFLHTHYTVQSCTSAAAHSINGLVDRPSRSGSFKEILKVGSGLSDGERSSDHRKEDSQHIASAGKAFHYEKGSEPEPSSVNGKDEKEDAAQGYPNSHPLLGSYLLSFLQLGVISIYSIMKTIDCC